MSENEITRKEETVVSTSHSAAVGRKNQHKGIKRVLGIIGLSSMLLLVVSGCNNETKNTSKNNKTTQSSELVTKEKKSDSKLQKLKPITNKGEMGEEFYNNRLSEVELNTNYKQPFLNKFAKLCKSEGYEGQIVDPDEMDMFDYYKYLDREVGIDETDLIPLLTEDLDNKQNIEPDGYIIVEDKKVPVVIVNDSIVEYDYEVKPIAGLLQDFVLSITSVGGREKVKFYTYWDSIDNWKTEGLLE